MVFAASGNNGATTVSYPAAYNNVIAVGSAVPASPGANPTRSSFSNYGTALDLLAPGEGVVQETISGGTRGYYAMSGTSMASPHAAAVAAMLISYKGVNPAKVRDAMFNTAFNHKGKRTNALGYGIINAQKAMQNYAR
jgi:subtilisin family serine protease